MRRAQIRVALGELIADELSSLNVAFTHRYPGSQLENEHVYLVAGSESALEFSVMTGPLVTYDDEFELECIITTSLSGQTHEEALLRCEVLMQAVIDATTRPLARRRSEMVDDQTIDLLPTTVTGPISEERSAGDGAEAAARITITIHVRTERSLADA